MKTTKMLLGALAGFALVVGLAGCPDNPYNYETWTKKLGDQKEGERAVTELENLGNPNAIPALGEAWKDQGKPVRLLQVIIALAHPMTKEQAAADSFTDYEENGREASWDKAMPFLKEAIDSIDENNPRSVESAQKAAGAIGEAAADGKGGDGLDSLIAFASKPPSKKIIVAQVDAIKSLGMFEGEQKAKAAGALEKLVDQQPPPKPATGKIEDKDRSAQALIAETYGLFAGITGAAVNALGELRSPSSVRVLVLSLYRTPELFTQSRRALASLGPVAEQALQQTLEGKYQPVTDLMKSARLDKYCDKPDHCIDLSMKDFYAAVVLGDFYDPKTVPAILAAMAQPPAPVTADDAKDPDNGRTQMNAIFDALRKIGAPEAAVPVRNIWMGTQAGSSAGKKPGGKPAADEGGGRDLSLDTKIQAVDAYPYVARDQTGLKELGVIAGDNGADDTLRTQAATAFARLASSKDDVAVLLVLSKKYLEESAKRTTEAGKLKPDFDKAEAALAEAKKASDEAKTAAQQAAKNTGMSAADFKAVADKAKAAEDAYKDAKKKHNIAVAPYNGKMNDAKGYKGFARMFQTHASRIEVAIRCGKDPKCFVDTLKETDEDAVKHVQGYVKDEAGKEEDLSKWTKEEKLGLREGEIERAMLEIGKMGQAASSFTPQLLDAVKSDDRIIRQSIMLALPKIAKVPCDTCEAKLAAAVTAGEGKVTLGDLNVETTMLRNYFAWAGGRTPTKTKAAPAAAPAAGGGDGAKTDDKPAGDDKKADEKPAEKPADPAPAAKAPDPAPAKADPKKGTPPAKTPPKKGGHK